jgi:hypothetical protein
MVKLSVEFYKLLDVFISTCLVKHCYTSVYFLSEMLLRCLLRMRARAKMIVKGEG